MIEPPSKIFVAGHRGMVGSAIVRRLQTDGCRNILVANKGDVNLLEQRAVREFFAEHKPDRVILAAARVGGIHANDTMPGQFIYENLMIAANVIHEAYAVGVSDLLYLGSSCIYPKLADQPMSEEALLTGALEPTNEPYAVAKIAGLKLCESYNREYGTDFRSVMPTNLYGPGDNFDLDNGHVVPALIRKVHEAKHASAPDVAIWGSGRVKREFLHVDDMAAACVHVCGLSTQAYQAVTSPMLSHINVGTGEDVSIAELATLICDVVGYTGALRFDTTKPDGAPRKLLRVSKLRELGWSPKFSLRDGLVSAYNWYLENQDVYRR